MKKIMLFSLIFIFILTACYFSASAATEKTEKEPAGVLTLVGVDEDTLNKVLDDIHVFDDLPYSGYKYFDNLNSMIMGLQSGVISMIATDEYTAGYLISRSDAFAPLTSDAREEVYYNYAMVLREEDQALCGRISEAIDSMKTDGTLETLKKQYIDDCIAGTDPTAVEPAVFEGADTLTIALTGDRPPMDYFSETGIPIGFNTALISEVAKRLGMNVQFISIDSGARAISLSSGRTDIVFWTELGEFDDWEKGNSEDLPEHTIPTHPYLRGKDALVVLADSEFAARK